MAGKEAVIIILDINKNMNSTSILDTSENPKTRLQIGIESIKLLIQQKMLFNHKDELGLILVGTEESDNRLNEENENDCLNISFARALEPGNRDFLELLDMLQTTDYQGDLLNSLELAIDTFERTYGQKKVTKRVFLITDGESSALQDKLEIIANKINERDIKLNMILIDFFKEVDEDPAAAHESNGIINLENDDGGKEGEDVVEANGDSNGLNNEHPKEKIKKIKLKETFNQLSAKKTIKRLLDRTPNNARAFSSATALKIYKQFRKKRVNAVTKFRGPLEITPNLGIDVCVYTKTTETRLPSLKKFSLATGFGEDPKQGLIQNEKVHYVFDDPEKTPVTEEHKVKAYFYGKSLVPINKTEEQMFKNEETRILKAIGFTDSFRVPRHYYMGGVDIVVPNPASDPDKTAFTAFVQGMVDLNKVLICRFVPRANAEAKLVCLIPYIGSRGAYMYLNTLPTSEDIRDYQFSSLQECTKNQESAISNFIDSLDLVNEGEEKLKPSLTFNPVNQHFYQCLEHRALKNITDLPDLDIAIADYLRPDKELFEGNEAVEELPKHFKIKEKEAEDKKKRVFWREIIENEINENTGVSESKLEDKLNSKKEESKKNVGTINPIDDFKQMLSNKYDDLTIPAMSQMSEVITKFIRESYKGSKFITAIDCLKTMRDSCIEEDEPLLFNSFLEQLRSTFKVEENMDWWKLVLINKIALITKKENKGSEITEEEAQKFTESLNKRDVIISNIADVDEDLIADID